MCYLTLLYLFKSIYVLFRINKHISYTFSRPANYILNELFLCIVQTAMDKGKTFELLQKDAFKVAVPKVYLIVTEDCW